MYKTWFVLIVVALFASCATTLPTYNPDSSPESDLVRVTMTLTDGQDLNTAWAIVAVDGTPVNEITPVAMIESNNAYEGSNGLLLPVGTHVFTIKFAKSQTNNVTEYFDQELDVTFSLEKSSVPYRFERTYSDLRMGYTEIVLHDDGLVGQLLGQSESVALNLVGTNEWEVEQ